MPPMITTIRELMRKLTSSPGPTEMSEPPSIPLNPASAEPTVNTTAKISWTLTPCGDHLAVVDAGAHDHACSRLAQPEPVPSPIAIAHRRMKKRTNG